MNTDKLPEIVLPGDHGVVASNELLVLVGETASGKSSLAITLAKHYRGEIVGADSVQVYRGFDIGSGKVTREEQAIVPHHLIDVADANSPLDAADFVRLADACIADCRARGRVPIVCGGTFFWVRALLFGLASAPSAPPELRARLQAEALELGAPALHERLREVDPVSAERLHGNDAVRVIRALEVFEITGKPLSEWQQEHAFREQRYRFRLVGIRYERERLHQRIHSRICEMFRLGWVDEVRHLIVQGYGQSRAMGAVGYAEIARYLQEKEQADGPPSDEEQTQLIESIARVTRVFARRQRTWLAKAEVTWLDADAVAHWILPPGGYSS